MAKKSQKEPKFVFRARARRSAPEEPRLPAEGRQASNNYFYWVKHIKYVMNIKYINDILDPHELLAGEDVKNDNDFDHCCQTRLLTELINGSYDRGRFQEQYLFWLLVTKMASGSLITIFRQRIINLRRYGDPW